MKQLYKHLHAPSTDTEMEIAEATIRCARFGKPNSTEDPQPLSLTVQLTCRRGTTVAIFTNLDEVWDLMHALNVQNPEHIEGKKVFAHFNARQLVGISPHI